MICVAFDSHHRPAIRFSFDLVIYLFTVYICFLFERIPAISCNVTRVSTRQTFRKRVKSWLWCTVGVSLSFWSYYVWMWTFICKQSDASDAFKPLYFSEPHEGKMKETCVERWYSCTTMTQIPSLWFLWLLLSTTQSIEWMLNMLISVYVWDGNLWGGRVRVVKAWSWEWLCNILGDAFRGMLLSLACWWPLTPQIIMGSGTRERRSN